ncbi:apolipoprotein N-acyltransferase [Variovorax sp. RHLX14]|uniref:apolipoprotein N-acyltransferase n=1 Tax=Variovorax sp. RHLX14 TaxID=1259731 RepID=UPI003F46595B
MFGRLALFGSAGLMQAASTAAPWNGQPLWWLQLLSLALLVWLLDGLRATSSSGRTEQFTPRDARWRVGLLGSWLFATAWLCGTFWWLFVSLHTYGGLAAPLAVTAILALAAGLALYYALACSFYVAYAPKSRSGAAMLFAALWTLGELLRGSWFTGFPWGAGGYAHVDGPLGRYAPWLGVYGIGAVAAAIAALATSGLVGAIIDSRSARDRRPAIQATLASAALIAVLVGAPSILDLLRTPVDAPLLARGRLTVALLQGNIPQDEKFVPGGGIATALRWYGDELRDATAPLVITPETALPVLPSQLPPGYLDAITARYVSGNQAAIIGLPLRFEEAGSGGAALSVSYRNAVLGFQPQVAGSLTPATPYRYDKHHLVPFGEFVPGMFRWFTDLMNIPLGDFRSGGLAQAPFVWMGQRIAPNICYEDLFGDEIGANFRDAASAPTMLLNVSNIAWFGDTVAIDQHLAISRMRALEFERPMVRATNTGATVVIDHLGRVTHALPRLTRGVLVADVEGRSGITPFAWWVSRFGLWPLWGFSLLTIAAAFAVGMRRRA